jgi:hypothetical protein
VGVDAGVLSFSGGPQGGCNFAHFTPYVTDNGEGVVLEGLVSEGVGVPATDKGSVGGGGHNGCEGVKGEGAGGRFEITYTQDYTVFEAANEGVSVEGGECCVEGGLGMSKEAVTPDG